MHAEYLWSLGANIRIKSFKYGVKIVSMNKLMMRLPLLDNRHFAAIWGTNCNQRHREIVCSANAKLIHEGRLDELLVMPTLPIDQG